MLVRALPVAIVGGADGEQPLASEPLHVHASPAAITIANRAVDPAGTKRGELEPGVKAQVDVRVRRAERAHSRHEPARGEAGEQADAQLGPGRLRRRERRVEHFQRLAHRNEQPLRVRGRHHAVALAREQREPKFCLKRA